MRMVAAWDITGSLSMGKKVLIDGQQWVTALITALVGQQVVDDSYNKVVIKIAFHPRIIDYKTGAHTGGGLDEFLDREQERYRQQLEPYASAMSKMEERPIRLGLYFPLLGGGESGHYSGGLFNVL